MWALGGTKSENNSSSKESYEDVVAQWMKNELKTQTQNKQDSSPSSSSSSSSSFLSARPPIEAQKKTSLTNANATVKQRVKILVMGPDGQMTERLVDPNNMPKSLQRVPMTGDSLERLMKTRQRAASEMLQLTEVRRRAALEAHQRAKEAQAREVEKMKLSLELSKAEQEKREIEEKRRTAEAEKEAEALRLKRLEEENRSSELVIKTLELQRNEAEIEAERRLQAERNKSVELDLQFQSMKDWKLECAVCLSAPARYAIIPCGHYVLCTDCRKEYETDQGFDDRGIPHNEKEYKGTCPMCRVKVAGLLRIFIAATNKDEKRE